MIRLPAPDILRHWRSRVCHLSIPGGWQMRIPAVQAEGPFADAYLQYFLRQGLSFDRAQEQAAACIQDIFTAGFRASLLSSTFYWAKKYAELFPHTLQPAGSTDTFIVAGFQPALMQKHHVPGEYPGRDGLAQARTTLITMEEAYDAG